MLLKSSLLKKGQVENVAMNEIGTCCLNEQGSTHVFYD